MDKVTIKPHLVLVESADLLDLRNATTTPVANLLSPPNGSGKRGRSDADTSQNEQSSPDRIRLGNELIELNSAHDEDRKEVEKFAKLVPENADLREPFERIREALVETVRMSSARPA